jgi:photosystem II stability/assembly factor-like uncharacterized protein
VTGRQLSHRERRGIALIAFAVFLIGSAGVIYLHSTVPTAPKSTLPNAVDRNFISANPVDYDFLTPTAGWALIFAANEPLSAIGRFWVFGSTDGAKHWHQELTGQSGITGLSSHSIQFVDASHGFVFVGGAPDQLYRTDDAGAHWAAIHLPEPGAAEVAFTDTENGWLLSTSHMAPIQDSPFVGPFHLHQTSDGGVNWHGLPDSPTSASFGAFRNATQAWMGGLGFGKPFVYVSSDAGQTWNTHFLPSPPGQTWDDGSPQVLRPSNVTLLPGSGVVADVTDRGEQYLFTSFDSGTTWQFVAPPLGVMAYEDSRHWWALSGNTLFKSSDAGQSWIAVSHAAPPSLRAIRVIDSQHAWGVTVEVGGYGLVVTSDGGQRWTKSRVPHPDEP